MARDLLDVIHDASKATAYRAREGVILAVSPVRATVQRVGSFTPIECEYDPSMGVVVGKRCVVDWIQGRRYVIISVYGTSGSIQSGDQTTGSLELAPPSSLETSSVLSGCILLTWDAPPQQVVTFEIQRNTIASESGALIVAMTRGSSYIDTVGETAHFRVRSVTSAWKRSGWSSWVSGNPGTALTELTFFNQVISDHSGDVLTDHDGNVILGH